MTYLLTMPVGGTLGNDKGMNNAGMLAGYLEKAAVGFALLKTLAQPCLCITDDGGLYVDETTAANNATADDVEWPATIAVDDAMYFGHASTQFSSLSIEVGVAGSYTAVTMAWEYWNGTAWTALASLVDGTLNPGPFMSTVDTVVAVTFTLPTDWAKNTVDSVLGYWVRARCTDATGGTTAAELDQAWVVMPSAAAVYIDDTTDINSAGAADVALTAAAQMRVGDGFYFGHASARFCKLQITTSTALVATATQVWKYWNGTAWTAIPVFKDDSAGWVTTAGTLLLHFEPPSDWVANTAANGPGGNAGYFIVLEVTAFTSLTTAAVATQAWLYPINTAAVGVRAPVTGTAYRVDSHAITPSATNNDSVFLLVNATQGTSALVTWTKGEGADQNSVNLAVDAGDELVLVQLKEDGTTEFAGAAFHVTFS